MVSHLREPIRGRNIRISEPEAQNQAKICHLARFSIQSRSSIQHSRRSFEDTANFFFIYISVSNTSRPDKDRHGVNECSSAAHNDYSTSLFNYYHYYFIAHSKMFLFLSCYSLPSIWTLVCAAQTSVVGHTELGTSWRHETPNTRLTMSLCFDRSEGFLLPLWPCDTFLPLKATAVLVCFFIYLCITYLPGFWAHLPSGLLVFAAPRGQKYALRVIQQHVPLNKNVFFFQTFFAVFVSGAASWALVLADLLLNTTSWWQNPATGRRSWADVTGGERAQGCSVVWSVVIRTRVTCQVSASDVSGWAFYLVPMLKM